MNFSLVINASSNVSITYDSPRGIVLIVFESCIFLVLNIIALVGNLLVCVAFYRNRSLRTVTNNFILSLALTDLLMAVFVMPLVSTSSIANMWVAGEFGLEIYEYCGNTVGGTSLLTVMLLAMNRYFRVVKPLLYRNIYSKKTSTFMAVTAWIVTTLLASVGYPLAGVRFQTSRFNPATPLPYLPNRNALTYYYVTFGIYIIIIFPSLVVVICYLKIYQTIRQHNSAAAPSSQKGHSSYGVKEAKMTRLLTVVVVCFYLCWLPVVITNTLTSTKVLGEPATKYRNLYHSFPIFASSVINPIVYGVMNQPFRTKFLKIIRSLYR